MPRGQDSSNIGLASWGKTSLSELHFLLLVVWLEAIASRVEAIPSGCFGFQSNLSAHLDHTYFSWCQDHGKPKPQTLWVSHPGLAKAPKQFRSLWAQTIFYVYSVFILPLYRVHPYIHMLYYIGMPFGHSELNAFRFCLHPPRWHDPPAVWRARGPAHGDRSLEFGSLVLLIWLLRFFYRFYCFLILFYSSSFCFFFV